MHRVKTNALVMRLQVNGKIYKLHKGSASDFSAMLQYSFTFEVSEHCSLYNGVTVGIDKVGFDLKGGCHGPRCAELILPNLLA